MRCDCCPLCFNAEGACSESEGVFGIDHADGMGGCRRPRNWVDKMDRERDEYLANMGTDMGIESLLCEEDMKIAIDYCKHMVGLDYKQPYRRHGKYFYKPYRNYYYAATSKGNVILNKFPSFIMTKEFGSDGVWYILTPDGLKWLGRVLKITIKERGA